MDTPGLYTEEDICDLTATQLEAVACEGEKRLPGALTLFSQSGAHHYKSANGKYFTIQEFLDIVGDFETKTRGCSKWFGGIDAHHVFFEGVRGCGEGCYRI